MTTFNGETKFALKPSVSPANDAVMLAFCAPILAPSNNVQTSDAGGGLAAVILSQVPGSDLVDFSFAYTGIDPTYWGVWTSADGGNTWTNWGYYPAARRAFSGGSAVNLTWKVFGADSNFFQVTPESNWILALAAPAPTISSNAANTLSWLVNYPVGYSYLALEGSSDGVNWVFLTNFQSWATPWAGSTPGLHYRARFTDLSSYTSYSNPVVSL